MRGKEVSNRRSLARVASAVAFAAAALLLAAPAGAVFATGSWSAGPSAAVAPADAGKGALDVLEPVAPASESAVAADAAPAERVVKEWVATNGERGGGGPKSSKGK
jgi:hypothetical protein